MVEWFGKYHRIARPGFSCVLCCFGQSVAGRLSTALQHHEASGAATPVCQLTLLQLYCRGCTPAILDVDTH